jgi:arabinose-5-phosphate isomerase
VTDPSGRLLGVFTDGDLRRQLERAVDVHETRIGDLMTRDPRTIDPDRLAVEAVEAMEHRKINGLLVVGADGKLVGALNMHDLLRAGVV